MNIKSEETVNKHDNARKVYGKMAYSICFICGFYLHLMAKICQEVGRNCFFNYHNDDCFGLAHTYAGLSKTKSNDWNYP